MNNLSSSFKKFIGNKNTVTILGVVLCIVILYFAYNYRINQQVQLVTVPYANQEIPPKTLVSIIALNSLIMSNPLSSVSRV